jgi:hypothetical protein
MGAAVIAGACVLPEMTVIEQKGGRDRGGGRVAVDVTHSRRKLVGYTRRLARE